MRIAEVFVVEEMRASKKEISHVFLFLLEIQVFIFHFKFKNKGLI
jgi:hypothetical protein